ncbi:hypothetical protein ACK3SF_03370 [Candidatus Nanosalina sp. VS9-1]|uniref:hypothetical protein n=1 Tax=Candidatus Nanosalina sp. VS9-1 TaxID=3388566 RepID=UPI0039E19A61
MRQFPQQDSQGIEALLEPGEAEPRLSDFLQGLEDFSEGFVVPPLQDKRCALCTITDYPYNQGEIVFQKNNDFYIVETADMKGHERRNMLVLNDHSYFPGDEEFAEYAAQGLRSLVDYTHDDGPVVAYAGNTTFHHPHIVASDTVPDDVEEAKLGEVSNYIVFDDPEDLSDPMHEEYGNVIGEAFLKRFYDSAVQGL